MTVSSTTSVVATFGSLFESPGYLPAYAKASKALFQQAISEGRVNDLAQPVLYLQRHTTELAFKELLDAMHGCQRERHLWCELLAGGKPTALPSPSDLDLVHGTHRLDLLHQAIDRARAILDLPALPAEFGRAVAHFQSIDANRPDAFRYPATRDGVLNAFFARDHETPGVVAPVGEIQDIVDQLAIHCRFDPEFPEPASLVEDLYIATQSLTEHYLGHLEKLTCSGHLHWTVTKDPAIVGEEVYAHPYLRAEFQGRPIVISSVSGAAESAFLA